ncbi:hypothetical protein [Algoriphagus resistens]|uniref:hypothetical protein n=1 Tax=Algoriphagus resistens TaxID=1750590 RepID=UPI000B18A05E|nr:hypothetical protein [Algoriphagus resistens]
MYRLLIVMILGCFLSISSYSQELNLFLQDIKEERLHGQTQRSTSDSISKITFTTAVNGIKLDEYHLIKLGRIQVIDDTGKSLEEIKDVFYNNEVYHKDKRMEFTVKAPVRQATKIKMVEGILLYFTPTQANKGKVIIRDFLQRKDENLLADSYPEIELKLMDNEKLINMQEEMQKMVDKEVEKRKKEGTISEEEQQEIDYAREFIEDIMGMVNGSSKRATLTFQLNQPLDQAFYRISIFNENDTKISSGYYSIDTIYQFYLSEAPTKNCYIEILMENENAVKELPFQFLDVVLP